MGFIIVILTIAMVLDSLALIGLILIQLPKKDTGGGLAFGGSATDALFGAGSGNVLTKVTKYFATGFFVLAILLSILQKNYHARTATAFGQKLSQPGNVTMPSESVPTTPAENPTPAPATPPAVNTNMLLNFPAMTNAPKPAATNPAAK